MEKKTSKTDSADLAKYKEQVDFFLSATADARYASIRDRDYYDGYQWTEEELGVLKRRKQAPIVVNRVKPKVEGLKGLLAIRKTDIKAFPRNYKNDEDSAHAVTDALNYVYDDNDFDSIKSEVFENKVIEGYGAACVEVEQNIRGEIDVTINPIPFDRFYFDPHSRRKDFSDARFMGEIIWLDEEETEAMFPDADLSQLENDSQADNDTFEDRPKWVIREAGSRRIRIAKHYFKKKGVWFICEFTNNVLLSEPRESPYLDEDGQPMCPIEGDSAYVDKLNQRYGEVRGFIDQQDEINHRRSKALHLLSTRQTVSRKGAIDDLAKVKRELAKADGHVEYTGEQGDFEVLPTGDMATAQFEFYQDSKAEMDATSFNAQLAGERQSGDLSGKAIDRLQSAGAMEINSLYAGTSNWNKRIARQVWARIKQFWNEEKWIRVTDDQDNLRWVGLNSQITFQKMLEETIKDESKPLAARAGASATLAIMLQKQDPRLQAIVQTKNNVAELDVDVILEESFDVVNIQQEQFQMLVELAKTLGGVDIIDIIQLSQLRNKKEIIDKIEQRQAAMAQTNGNIAQMQSQKLQVDNAKGFAETQKITQEANQKAIENQILITNPPQQVSSVAV